MIEVLITMTKFHLLYIQDRYFIFLFSSQSTHPISSSITPLRPFLCFSSPLLIGGHCCIRVRSFSTSGIAAARLLWLYVSWTSRWTDFCKGWHTPTSRESRISDAPAPRLVLAGGCVGGQCLGRRLAGRRCGGRRGWILSL